MDKSKEVKTMVKSQGPKLFDYGLDSAQEERSKHLHRESIIIDIHFEGPVAAAAYTEDMVKQIMDDYEKDHNAERNMYMAMALPARMAARGEFPAFKEWWDISGVTAGDRQEVNTNGPLEVAMRQLAMVTLQFDRLDWLIKAISADDIRRAKAEGKHAGFISAEFTIAMGQNLDNLDMFHEFGLNKLQLTYNSMNFVGAGCTERTDAGVSNFGVKFIERMNKLGIIVDIAHCGHQTTLDACQISKYPVIASHTAAQGVYNHARGKSDEELEALAKTGGVIGVVTIPRFLADPGEATMEHFLNHIDYIIKLVGHKHVGIGTDWPESLPEWGLRMLREKVAPLIGFRPEDLMGIGTETVKGFDDYREFINITRGLVSRGYSDDEIRDILGGNWLRVMEAVWK